MTLSLPDIMIKTSLPDAAAIIGLALGLGEEPQDRCPACGMPVALDSPHQIAQVVVQCTGWYGNIPFLLCAPCATGDATDALRNVAQLLRRALHEVASLRSARELTAGARARRN